jgi:hypothetical protein
MRLASGETTAVLQCTGRISYVMLQSHVLNFDATLRESGRFLTLF